MADMIIRGIDTPESCFACVQTHLFFRNLHCSELEGMSSFIGSLPHSNDRHPNCPLSSLPEGHGKIIDADAIWGNMTEDQARAFQRGLASDVDLFEILEAANAIVPAEKGKDE